LLKDTTCDQLAGLVSTVSLNAERQSSRAAANNNFLKSFEPLDKGIKYRSTEYEADPLTIGPRAGDIVPYYHFVNVVMDGIILCTEFRLHIQAGPATLTTFRFPQKNSSFCFNFWRKL